MNNQSLLEKLKKAESETQIRALCDEHGFKRDQVVVGGADELKGKNGCSACDGYGIIVLYGGPYHEMEARCIECSGDKHLNDIYAHRNKWLNAAWKDGEQKLIQEHNDRINGVQRLASTEGH